MNTSRLARNIADAIRLYQRLNFAGVRELVKFAFWRFDPPVAALATANC